MYLNPAKQIANVTNVVDNGSGLCRVTAVAHGLVTGDRVLISEIFAGSFAAVGATGYWTVTRIDDNTLDLDGSTFDDTLSGGFVSGGSAFLVDRVTASLSSSTTTNPVLVQLNTKTFDFTTNRVTRIGRYVVQATGTTPSELLTQSLVNNTQVLETITIVNNDTANSTVTVAIDNGKSIEQLVKVLLEPGFSYNQSSSGVTSLKDADGKVLSPAIEESI